MSPRAACRLEHMGFEVYDYAAGKVDWLAAGLQTVRADHAIHRAGDAVDKSPPTCSAEARVGDVAGDSVLVVTDDRVVLGRLRPADHAPTARAEDVMEPGPATVRAHEPLHELLERMKRRGVPEVVVTNPEGQLLGVIRDA